MDQETAATRIQAAYRGHQARSPKQTKRDLDKETKAATRIQAGWRGHQARGSYRTNRDPTLTVGDEEEARPKPKPLRHTPRGFLYCGRMSEGGMLMSATQGLFWLARTFMTYMQVCVILALLQVFAGILIQLFFGVFGDKLARAVWFPLVVVAMILLMYYSVIVLSVLLTNQIYMLRDTFSVYPHEYAWTYLHVEEQRLKKEEVEMQSIALQGVLIGEGKSASVADLRDRDDDDGVFYDPSHKTFNSWTMALGAEYRRRLTCFLSGARYIVTQTSGLSADMAQFTESRRLYVVGNRMFPDRMLPGKLRPRPFNLFSRSNGVGTLVFIFHIGTAFFTPLGVGIYRYLYSQGEFWAGVLGTGVAVALGHTLIQYLLFILGDLWELFLDYRENRNSGLYNRTASLLKALGGTGFNKAFFHRLQRNRYFVVSALILAAIGFVIMLAVTFFVGFEFGLFACVMGIAAILTVVRINDRAIFRVPLSVFTVLLIFFSLYFIIAQSTTVPNNREKVGKIENCPSYFFTDQRADSCVGDDPTEDYPEAKDPNLIAFETVSPSYLGTGYSICDGEWGGLDVLDLGLMARLSYGSPYACNMTNSNWHVIKTSEKDDHIKFYHLQNNVTGTNVITVRGTENTQDILLDNDIYNEIVVLQVFSIFSPVLQIWPRNFVVDVVYQSSFLEKWTTSEEDERPFYQNLVEYVKKVKAKDDKLVITGHSLGGLIAKIAAAHNKMRAVTFSSPGMIYSRRKFGLTEKLINLSGINTAAYGDPVVTTDKLGGQVQHIECRFNDESGVVARCHSLSTTLCELISKCGVGKSSLYSDFKQGVGIDPL